MFCDRGSSLKSQIESVSDFHYPSEACRLVVGCLIALNLLFLESELVCEILLAPATHYAGSNQGARKIID